ncbi:MAG: flagellar M-ring protein FliF [Deltaproteobacteria bacterium]|nr:flagellar M-ring protein FliF [Deltaproteobacteria bacterium]
MSNFFEQLREFLTSLTLVRKITILATLIVAISAISYLVSLSGKVSYEPLFTNMNSEDLGAIVARLDKQGTAYQVDQTQRTVMVPGADVLKIRMKMAEEGLPRFGGVGFEIFDKAGFGKSDFEQHINFQRALEGELTRTILSLREVEKARVHLVLPEKSIFSQSQQAASASVILKLGRSGALPENTVQSITHLVASAVEGLDSSNVTVVDSEGRLLSSPAGDASSVAGGQAYNQKNQIEKNLEHRIVDLLSPVVGVGKVMARVTADIDFTRSETTEETVDPNRTAVLQESKTKNKKSEADNANSAAGSGNANGANSQADENVEQTSYEVSKTVKKLITPIGAIKSLSVAILVDGNYVADKAGKKQYTPRAAEELTRIDELVKGAIGFTQARGDQVKITNLAFQAVDAQLDASSEAWYKQKNSNGFIISVIANVLIVVALLLVFLLVVRPLIASWNGASQRILGPRAKRAALQSGSDVNQLVRVNPVAATAAIRKWLE